MWFYTRIQIVGHWSTLLTSHDMLQGVHMDKPVRISLFVSVIFCSRLASRAYLSTSLLLSSQIEKCIAIGLRTPGMHATRWLASGLIAFLKRLADFMEKMRFCTIPTWMKLTFLHRNSKLVIMTRHPNSAFIIENIQKHCFHANPLNRNS